MQESEGIDWLLLGSDFCMSSSFTQCGVGLWCPWQVPLPEDLLALKQGLTQAKPAPEQGDGELEGGARSAATRFGSEAAPSAEEEGVADTVVDVDISEPAAGPGPGPAAAVIVSPSKDYRSNGGEYACGNSLALFFSRYTPCL
jgi:hypothetical protein